MAFVAVLFRLHFFRLVLLQTSVAPAPVDKNVCVATVARVQGSGTTEGVGKRYGLQKFPLSNKARPLIRDLIERAVVGHFANK